MENNVFIGFNAGVEITEGNNIVIIGDNIKSLDKNQKDVMFIGEKIAIGKTLFGEHFNLREIVQKHL